MIKAPETEVADELTPLEAAKGAGCRFNVLGVVTAVWAAGLLISGNPYGAMTTGTIGLLSEIMAVAYNREAEKLSPNSH